MENQTDILLEAGTNELEIMVLDISGRTFGVNIAKVREVILPKRIHPCPDAGGCVEGVFHLRDQVVELVDLREHLGMGKFSFDDRMDPKRSQIVVTEFNQTVVGFRVSAVDRIIRTSWDTIEPVPSVCSRGGTPLVGIANINDEIIQMLDLERIIFDLNPTSRMNVSSLATNSARGEKRIIVAEDSETIRMLMVRELTNAGYTNILDFSDGLSAWTYISESPEQEVIHLVVSDIEMPRLDGLHLCKRIRQEPRFAKVPVILFSSLINARNLNKGEQVGASAQIAKPELSKLVHLADDFLGISESLPTA